MPLSQQTSSTSGNSFESQATKNELEVRSDGSQQILIEKITSGEGYFERYGGDDIHEPHQRNSCRKARSCVVGNHPRRKYDNLGQSQRPFKSTKLVDQVQVVRYGRLHSHNH